MTSKYLAIYLNDHLAGSTGALELVRRAARENEGSELGTFLEGLGAEILADRRTLEQIMASLEVSVDRRKNVLAWLAEKAGRLKLNGELVRYSPLSPVVELEALSAGIEAKRLLWVALADTVADRIGADRLRELIARAESQRAGVERHRVAAARGAFTPGS
jgi:hypothetical protein